MRSATSPFNRTESRELTRELARRLSERLALSQRPAQQVSAGVALLKSGDSVTRLPFIIQGRVDSVLHLHGDDGGRVIPVSWNDGEFVLLSQLFMGRPSFVDLIAATNLSLRWASVAEMEEALLQDSDLLVLLVRVLAQRLREVQTRERIWVERGVHQRLCATLARLAHHSEKDEAGHALIVATHEELAERSATDSRPLVCGLPSASFTGADTSRKASVNACLNEWNTSPVFLRSILFKYRPNHLENSPPAPPVPATGTSAKSLWSLASFARVAT